MDETNQLPTPPSPIEPFDVEDRLKKLTAKEKISLLSGMDHWHTRGILRLCIPSIRLSDGPNGVRGTRFFNRARAACFPCGTALAATWDTELLQKAGELMGQETKAKGAHVLLGPTVNMQRSPLGGRGFESFSEDPLLSGLCASAIIKGIQETGVVATIKHFVANDQEHERMAVDSIVTERALREIYLLPFQIAIRDSRPGCVMTAYNKVNGLHVSESPKFIQNILKEEWSWKGLVMSDWYATYSTSETVNGGLDLEMPGPTRWRGQILAHALLSNKVAQHTLDDRTGVPEHAPEGSQDTPETTRLLRKIASESVVLLKNENNALPFRKDKTVAVIGPNAKMAAYCGGGSATLSPYYTITPFEGISSKAADVRYSIGFQAHKLLPLLGPHLKTADGETGVTFKAFTSPATIPERQPFDTIHLVDTYMYLSDYSHPALTEDLWWAEVEAFFTPDTSGEFQFGLTVYGTAKLFLDNALLIDNETEQRSGGSFFNVGTVEETATKHLTSGQTYKLKVEFASGITSKLADASGVVSFGGGGLRIGGARLLNPQEEIENAVQLARTVDQVVLCVGLNSDWEQEGHDRQDMDLPGLTNDMIEAVAAVNKDTLVVVQSGTPVSMPWEKSVAAVVQSWYGGNETGNAIADIVFGDVNPSGKLPLSFPVQVEDNPAFLNYRSERGRVLYGEDVYVGYRFYEMTRKATKWPFRLGLSYTSFRMSELRVTFDSDEVVNRLTVTVDLENNGQIDSAEVIQVYISPRSPSIKRPLKELKGFEKRHVKKGARETVKVVIERKYATSFWDEEMGKWIEESGIYDILVGNSSANTPLKASFKVNETKLWSGL